MYGCTFQAKPICTHRESVLQFYISRKAGVTYDYTSVSVIHSKKPK